MKFSPIAIVGRSVVLPGALSPEDLWTAVSEGQNLVQSAPEGRWRTDPADLICTPEGDPSNRAWSDKGGYVHGFEHIWDPNGFAVPAEELAGLDPLFHWTLHCARAALKDAGDERSGDIDRARVGAVFGNLGFPASEMTRYAESVWQNTTVRPDPRNRFMSSGAAEMLQRSLGLAPGVMCLDTACASSLYAIKLACDQLHDGAIDMALAGAVNRSDDLFIHVGFTALNAMSRSGQSRPFHADADGLVPANAWKMPAETVTTSMASSEASVSPMMVAAEGFSHPPKKARSEHFDRLIRTQIFDLKRSHCLSVMPLAPQWAMPPKSTALLIYLPTVRTYRLVHSSPTWAT